MRKAMILLGFSLMFSACSLFSPVKTPNTNTYTLSVEPRPTRGVAKAESTLLVSMPTAAPGFDTSQMVYTKKKHQLENFAYNRWIAPPAEMLAPLLGQHMKNTGCFSAVVSTQSSGVTDFNLQTNITTFQQEFVDRGQVRVGVNITLLDNTSAKVRQKWIEVVMPVSKGTPYAGVIAMNEAVSSMLRQVGKFACLVAKQSQSERDKRMNSSV